MYFMSAPVGLISNFSVIAVIDKNTGKKIVTTSLNLYMFICVMKFGDLDSLYCIPVWKFGDLDSLYCVPVWKFDDHDSLNCVPV